MTTESKHNRHTVNDEISLKEIILQIPDWWRYFLTKWYIFLICGLIGGAVGLIYSFIKQPTYIATTTFVLEEEKAGGLTSLAGLASMAGLDLGGGGGGIFQGENILQLYKSRTMLEKTLLSKISAESSELLIDRYIKMKNLRDKWADKPKLLSLKFYADSLTRGDFSTPTNRLRDSILGKIVEDINKNSLAVSKLDKKLSIIKVNVKSDDEIFSKALNDILVRNVSEFYIQTKVKKSTDNVAILQYKTDSVRSVMNGAIYAAVAVADATPNLNPTRQIKRVAPAQRSQFTAETNKAVLGELIKNLEMSKISLLKEVPLIQIVDQPVFPLEVEKIGKAKGIIAGGLLAGLATLVVLAFKRKNKDIIND